MRTGAQLRGPQGLLMPWATFCTCSVPALEAGMSSVLPPPCRPSVVRVAENGALGGRARSSQLLPCDVTHSPPGPPANRTGDGCAPPRAAGSRELGPGEGCAPGCPILSLGGGVGAEVRVTQRVGTELKASQRAAQSHRPVEGAQDAGFWPSGSQDSWREAVR